MNGARVVLSLAIVFAMAGLVQASVHVEGSSLSANGQLAKDFQYTGPCPVDLKFDWGVVGTEPGKMTYSLVRNDGAHSFAPLSINLPAANHSISVTDEWRAGANTSQYANYTGWVQLEIKSPNPVSKKINFTLHCVGANVRINAGAFMANGDPAKSAQYKGPCPVALKFDWSVISTAPTKVTYSFDRSDSDESSASKSVDLPQANQAVSVFSDWKLGDNTSKFANYNGWVQLNIESPSSVSQKINFTIHCR